MSEEALVWRSYQPPRGEWLEGWVRWRDGAEDWTPVMVTAGGEVLATSQLEILKGELLAWRRVSGPPPGLPALSIEPVEALGTTG